MWVGSINLNINKICTTLLGDTFVRIYTETIKYKRDSKTLDMASYVLPSIIGGLHLLADVLFYAITKYSTDG